MTDTQYKVIAAHIARHCMNHLRFVYNANFDFGNFILSIRKGSEAPDIDFDANELLKYLN